MKNRVKSPSLVWLFKAPTLLLSIGFAVLFVGTLLAILPGRAFADIKADCTTQPACIVVKLSGDTSGITVTATRQGPDAPKSYTLSPYNGDSKTYAVLRAGPPSTNDGFSASDYMFDISITRNGKSVAAPATIQIKPPGESVIGPLTVQSATSTGAPSPTGSVIGGVYTNINGVTAVPTPYLPQAVANNTLATPMFIFKCTNSGNFSKSLTSLNGDGTFDGFSAPLCKYAITGQVANPEDQSQALTYGGLSGQIHTGSNPIYITITRDASGKVSATVSSKPPTLSNADKTPNKASCDDTGGFGLSWIICPVFNATAAFSDWVFQNLVQPFLRTSPISTDPSDPSFRVWSQFRVYGNVLLVIGLLVLVFGQSIGGGLIDAYTVKKSMPRILIAAILINLSVYIVAGLVDITNVVGGSIGKVMTDPLAHAGAFQFTPSGLQAGSIIGVSAGAGFIAVLAVPIATYLNFSIGAFILLFIVMPVVLGLLAAFITLIIRKAIILALIMVSPVAFALYCLPNTEKYFKKWWDFLVQTLLVYPIVIIIFAVADILSVTVYDANPQGPSAVVALVVSFVLQFLPLLMIPYAFKLAGGAVGLVHETLTNYHKRGQEAVKGNPNDPRSLRNRVRYGARSTINQGRVRRIDKLAAAATATDPHTRGGRFRRGVYTRLARGLNVGNVQADRAQFNREQAEIGDAQRNHGDDSNQRAFWAVQHTGPDDAHGRVTGRYYSPYQNADGSYKEWDPVNVAKARSLVKKDPSRFQDLARYELSKAADDDQLEAFKSRFTERAMDLGYSASDANGVWGGVKFAHQATRKELKHTAVIEDGNGNLVIGEPDHAALSNELADSMRKGDYSGFRSSTGKSALKGFTDARQRLQDNQYGGPNGQGKKAADEKIVKNYQDLADWLNKSLFQDPQRQAGRLAAEQAMQAAVGDGEEVAGYGFQASQRAEAAWEDFTKAARRPPTNGNGNGGAGGPAAPAPPAGGGLITPGTPGFNIPPGSRPPGN